MKKPESHTRSLLICQQNYIFRMIFWIQKVKALTNNSASLHVSTRVKKKWREVKCVMAVARAAKWPALRLTRTAPSTSSRLGPCSGCRVHSLPPCADDSIRISRTSANLRGISQTSRDFHRLLETTWDYHGLPASGHDHCWPPRQKLTTAGQPRTTRDFHRNTRDFQWTTVDYLGLP